MLQVVEPAAALNELLPAFRELTCDEQDSVRLLSVEACSAMARALAGDDATGAVLASMQQFGGDKSWRVRLSVALQVPSFAEVLGTDKAGAYLLPTHLQLLRDRQAVGGQAQAASARRPHPAPPPIPPHSNARAHTHKPRSCCSEPEVRAAAAAQLGPLARVLSPESIVTQLVPELNLLARDASHHVRTSLAAALMFVAPAIGKVRLRLLRAHSLPAPPPAPPSLRRAAWLRRRVPYSTCCP